MKTYNAVLQYNQGHDLGQVLANHSTRTVHRFHDFQDPLLRNFHKIGWFQCRSRFSGGNSVETLDFCGIRSAWKGALIGPAGG